MDDMDDGNTLIAIADPQIQQDQAIKLLID